MDKLTLLKRGIWLYFILLIFEGALRRWVLPSFSNPLLVVRDILAIYLLFKAYQANIFPNHIFVSIMMWLGVVSIFIAIFLGHGNVWVALFGSRIFIIQFPMLFLIGGVFTKDDVLEMGKWFLILAIPMAALVTLQFFSPQSAWINKGIGENIQAGFAGANGYFRPPGTFSFISGLSSFFGLVAAFVFYFWLNTDKINRLLLLLSSFALLAAIPTSVSRTLFFECCISLLFFLCIQYAKPNFLRNMIQVFFGIVLVSILIINLPVLTVQIQTLIARFENANKSSEDGFQGAVIDRFFNGFTNAFEKMDSQYLLTGEGIGKGTNVGAQLLEGKVSFLISEGEWGRLLGESGIIIGIIVIFIRISMSINYTYASFQRIRYGEYLPWMLSSYCFLQFLKTGWSTATSLGFYVLMGGLILASLKKEDELNSK
jgi:hypothetical protein